MIMKIAKLVAGKLRRVLAVERGPIQGEIHDIVDKQKDNTL